MTKFPFNLFSGYDAIATLGVTILTSYDDFMGIIYSNLFSQWSNYYENFLEWVAQYEFVDNIPKGFLHVKLNPNISDYNKSYVINGLRSYLKIDDLLFAKSEVG